MKVASGCRLNPRSHGNIALFFFWLHSWPSDGASWLNRLEGSRRIVRRIYNRLEDFDNASRIDYRTAGDNLFIRCLFGATFNLETEMYSVRNEEEAPLSRFPEKTACKHT
ncbi:hypothetical protein CEXT_249131 [Caerostris extrusa]|uniref:Uncharacterized protein n=1 Tax=Caerostris extrusa TaxID=172846 RepID=A0AAV4VCE7_CAEEX|nr:hypothetical protein CEXT_249131 [Caerostris extrusa]